MKVEIWSDIMCPFCYIGKRNYESALKRFANAEEIEVEWRSFQLDPSIAPDADQQISVYQYLADRKGVSLKQSIQMHEGLVETAKAAGLTYNFDKALVANSFDAHKMIQLAKTKGLGDAAEERLFSAYFTEGKNFGDPAVLVELGSDIGLQAEEVKEALTNPSFADSVQADIDEAQQLGVNGVPFFVFDRKYAISGAQPPEAFLQALEQSFTEWKNERPETAITSTSEGAVCEPGGDC